MLRRIIHLAVIVAVVFSVLVPTSAHPSTSIPAASESSTAALPPALAQAGLSAGAWQRMVDQIRADQAQQGCDDCATAAEFAELKQLLASDGDAWDFFGQSVGIWNDTIVVGARGDAYNQGAAYVFRRNQGGADLWDQVAKLTAGDGAGGDYFGKTVAIYGDTVVVGADGADISSNSDQGAAYVFHRNQGGADLWGQVAKLTASDGAAEDHLGVSVGIWGDTIVAGAESANTMQGAAYLFGRNQGGAEVWGQLTKLTASDGVAYDHFGASVAISGDTAVVGAYGADISGQSQQGAAYVFRRNQTGADAWGQAQKLVAGDGLADDQFGSSVALWHDTLVAGAYNDDVGANGSQGSAYVFERNWGGADSWGQVTRLNDINGAANDLLGKTVAVWGDRVVTSATGDDASRGSASVFARNQGGANAWGQVSKLIASSREMNDYFGEGVAIWGDEIVVGVDGDDVGANTDQGSAYLFTDPCAPVRQLKKETAADGLSNDWFGYSVAIWGDLALVGVPFANHPLADDAGAAYLFERNLGGADNWGLRIKLQEFYSSLDCFGWSVAIWENTAIVGAPKADVGGNLGQGAVYLFERNAGGADHWHRTKTLTASDAAQDDQFGCSVAIWGDAALVGAEGANPGGGSSQGAAYLFERNYDPAAPGTPSADKWGQRKKLIAADGALDDRFGHSVALWSDVALVGARYADIGGNTRQGAAYLFEQNYDPAAPGTPSPDNWGQRKKLTAADGALNDYFANSVALWHDMALVGAAAANPGGNIDQGAAYLFERNYDPATPGTPSPDNWGLRKKLTASDGAANAGLGSSVAIWGDTALVGAPGASPGGNTSRGAAYLFERNYDPAAPGTPSADNWGQRSQLTSADGASYDSFGASVAIWADTALVGAPGAIIGSNISQGAAYVFGCAATTQADVAITKAGQPPLVRRGAVVTYTVSYASAGPGPAANVYISDTLPAGLTYAGVVSAPPGWTGPTVAGQTIGWYTPTLAANASGSLVISANVSLLVPISADWLLTNTVAITATQDITPTNNSSTYTSVLQGLEISKSHSPEPVVAAVPFRYTITVTNSASAAATNLVITDTLPAEVDPASVVPGPLGVSNGAGKVTWTIASLGANASTQVWVECRTYPTAVNKCITNTVAADSAEAAPPISATDRACVVGSDVLVNKSGTPDLVRRGDVITYTINYANAGPGPAVNVYISDTLPAGLDYGGVVSAPPGWTGPTMSGQTIGWYTPTLAVNASGSLVISANVTLLVPISADWLVTNTAAITASQDMTPTNNVRTYTSVLQGLEIGKSHSPEPVTAAIPFRYTITITNSASSMATNLVITDTLPAEVDPASAVPGPGGVSNGAGRVTWTITSLGANASTQVWVECRTYPTAMNKCITNTVAVDSAQAAPPVSATDRACVVGSGIAVDKTGTPDLVRAGDVITYTINYANAGPGPAADVYISDTLPAGVSYAGVVSAPPGWTGPTVAGQTIGWYTPTLAANAGGSLVISANVTLLVPISADWLLTNTVAITATQDMTPTNNIWTYANVLQGLEIRKSHSPATVTAAWNFWYYIDVTNRANTPATNLVVSDTLPPEVAPYSVQPDMSGVFDGVNTVVWAISSLPPGATVRLTIKARTSSTAAGKCMTNLASADSDQAAPRVSTEHAVCVVAGELTRPTPTPTPTPAPTPVGTTVVIKRGGPGTSLDTYIYRNRPYSNFWLDPLLKVGYKQTHASLIEFDLSPIPAGVKVDEAWLEVWAAGWSGAFSDMTIGAYAISETVQISQTTWVSPELGATWTLPGANDVVLDRRPLPESTVTTSGPLKWYRFDVAKLVQEWLDGGTANNGVLLRCESCMGRIIKFELGAPEGAARELPPNGGLLGPMSGNLCPYTYFFASSENADQAHWPRLVVRYE